MNIRHFFTVCFWVIFSSLHAQQVGTWHTYLASYTTTGVAEAKNNVYAVADGTLYSFGKEDNNVAFYSIQTGLSDTDIKMIGYNPSVDVLLIVYNNGNIDFLDENGITNLSALKNAGNIQDKTIHSIYFHEERVYLATAFGIWVLQMDKKEVVNTYLLNQKTYGVSIRGEHIYASTNSGIVKASVNDLLLDPNNWQTLKINSSEFNTGKIRELCLFENNICFRADGSGIFYLNANDEVQTLLKNSTLKGMKLESGYLIPYTATTIFLYQTIHTYESKNLGITVNDISSLTNNGNFWIAAGEKALIGVKRKAANDYEIFVSDQNINGPKRNWPANLLIHNKKLYVTGGGWNINRLENQGTLMIYDGENWTNLNENEVTGKAGYPCMDYTSVAIDPNDENHYFVSSYGEGVLEFQNNQFVQLYNYRNSSLQSILPEGDNSRHSYVRIGSVAFDKDGSLWATNCEVSRGISKRSPDGQWESIDFPGLSTSYVVDKILITSRGDKWVNIPRSKTSVGVLIFNDDKKSHYETNFQSVDNNYIRSKVCYSMAEDLSGEIWLGTTQGPIICSAPNRALENSANLTFRHIILTDENGENYIFLENEQINAIAVDGGNRKWLGTSGSGIFVVSPDGKETIHHFTTENSDLFSNVIQSIVINDQTGEVFIGTDKGLVSYQSESTKASADYSDVYAYPNPVRPDFDNQVVITGLMADSHVKITDLSGNLIYQGKSAGGQMVWDCRNRSGNRVATGIYLVLSSTPKAKESVVTKIAVIK